MLSPLPSHLYWQLSGGDPWVVWPWVVWPWVTVVVELLGRLVTVVVVHLV